LWISYSFVNYYFSVRIYWYFRTPNTYKEINCYTWYSKERMTKVRPNADSVERQT
jgi:hypothetical protein